MDTKLRPFLKRKNFVFLLWEMERVLIKNMKHYGVMKLLNCSQFVLNFVSSRAMVVILFSILCPRISYHLSQSKFTYTGTFTFISLMNSVLIKTFGIYILKLCFESRKKYTTFLKIFKAICWVFSEHCFSTFI